MPKSTAVSIKGLTKRFSNGWFGRSTILNHLELDVQDNEIFGYLGANGAGKTTTFKLMLGLIKADQGQISFWGNPVQDLKTRAMIGYLPEHPYFYSYLTAQEALNFYGSLFDMDNATKKHRVEELLDLVNLNHAGNTQLRKFSRGMLQRIGIAQALINDPKLLILDEPMSGLDPMGRKAMRDIILSCRDQGKTIIFSSHIISDVEMICDRAGILSKGALKQIITMDDALRDEDATWEIACQGGELDLSNVGEAIEVKMATRGNRSIISTGHKQTAENIMAAIKAQGLDLVSFSTGRKSIEDIYLKTAQAKADMERDDE